MKNLDGNKIEFKKNTLKVLQTSLINQSRFLFHSVCFILDLTIELNGFHLSEQARFSTNIFKLSYAAQYFVERLLKF